MATLLEASTAAGAGLAAGLQGAVDQLSERQQFTFTLYREVILPLDGFRFWCLASALLDTGASQYNNRRPMGRRAYNATPGSAPPLTPVQEWRYTFTAAGSLHLSQSVEQVADSTIARQRVVFTAEQAIREFSDVAPGTLYFLTLPNGSLAAFSAQNMRYDAAGLWHYQGVALLPYESTQVVQNPNDLMTTHAIVSNSLPFWLGMSTPELPVWPSFLVPQNLSPPYVAVDIANTLPLALAPTYAADSSQSQLVAETVRFSFYGVRNDAALDFQRALLDNSFDGDYGTSSSPVPVDEKRAQADFSIIAQAKTMDLDVNYYQARARNVARQLILSAFITITPA